MSSDRLSTPEIIEELLSISDYLTESNADGESIPVLRDLAEPEKDRDSFSDNTEQANSSVDTNDEPDLSEESSKPHSTQSSLFDEHARDKPTTSERPAVKARGENPFLPPHIRKQLGKHKQVPLPKEELWPKQSQNKTLDHTPKTKVEIQGDLLNGFASASSKEESEIPLPEKNQQQLESVIDTLVEEAMPQLERKLRNELSRILQTWKAGE